MWQPQKEGQMVATVPEAIIPGTIGTIFLSGLGS